MAETQSRPRLVRFGAFEADVQTGELRKDGVKLKFSGQPFQVLAILLERPGEVVTREELQKRLWPDTFVDVERNLNTAVNKIREVLGDSAESPRFVETLPRRGYRFIAPVEKDLSLVNQDPIEKPIDKPARSKKTFRLLLPILGGGAVLAVGLILWISFSKTAGTPRVMRFTQLTHDGQGKRGPILSDGVRIYFNESFPDGRAVIAQVSVKGGEVTPLLLPIKAPNVRDLSRDGTELLIASAEGTAEGFLKRIRFGFSLSRADRHFGLGPLLQRMPHLAPMGPASSTTRDMMCTRRTATVPHLGSSSRSSIFPLISGFLRPQTPSVHST